MAAGGDKAAGAGGAARRDGLMIAPFVLVVSLFFLWGVANNLNDVLIAQFKKTFSLSDFQSGLVQSAFYLGYFMFAIPAALLMKRFGYKVGVLTGLALYGAGALLFVPAAEVHRYGAFLGALFVIAGGLAFLETSANPLVTLMGDRATAERRLNFAQSFNPMGAIAGVLIGRQFILSGVEPTPEQLALMSPDELARFQEAEAHMVQGPYLVLGLAVLAWAVLVLAVRFPAVAGARAAREEGPGRAGDFLALLATPRFLAGVVAQFAYVGAQVGVWSFMIRYAQHTMPGTGEKLAAAYLTWSLVAFMAGRFVATTLMGFIPAARLMVVYGGVNVALCLAAVAAPGAVGLIALAATSFFMSLMFPTIFALAIKDLGPRTQAGSSLLVMSIIGGAVLTAVMGRISDLAAINVAMLVPAACFAVVAAFAWSHARSPARLEAQGATRMEGSAG